jgi:predicted phage terminase large subunit-like protein
MMKGITGGARVFGKLAAALSSDWRVVARAEQLPPPGRWTIWLLLGGRGVGKTRTGAEWVNAQAKAGVSPIALVAATAGDARDIMIEGISGTLACSPERFRPEYQSVRRQLTWPNGATAIAYSADEPERLRGPNFAAAWCDEVGVWRYPQAAWDNLMLALRYGKNPRCVVSTTPRPTKLLKYLVSRADPNNPDAFTVLTRSRTIDNAANLAPAFLETITAAYQGTRLGRQELDAEMLDDVVGALWQRAWIDDARVLVAPADLTRVVVAVDPAVSTGENSDETGIIVAGRTRDGHGYVLDDLSGKFQPEVWARRAVDAFKRHKADRIVAESNMGGDLVRSNIRAVDANVPVTLVHASRGKVVRAEPVSTRYEQGRVHHVGTFALLEDQQCGFTSDFDRGRAGYSPDRVDALVWAVTELLGGHEQAQTFAPPPNLRGPGAFGLDHPDHYHNAPRQPHPDNPGGGEMTGTMREISGWSGGGGGSVPFWKPPKGY